jgi:multidrug efflux system outer membrane protein
MKRTTSAKTQPAAVTGGPQGTAPRDPRAGGAVPQAERWLVALGLFATLLAGCAVGPNYTPPPVDMPPEYRDASAGIDAAAIADLPWWDVFDDPTVRDLIDEALRRNYDLQIAASRVEQARYAVGVTRADLLPQAQYDGVAERGRFFNPFGGENPTRNHFLGAFQLAWELDIWGRVRRATEASLADLFAAEDVRRGVVLSLVTSVGQAYFELVELDAELQIARRTRDAFQDTLDLFTRQYRGGVGTKLDTSRAEASLANAAASIPEIERQIAAKENQISILLGRHPGPIPRGMPLVKQTMPTVPPGMPAALLVQRPDIMRSEQNVVAANAVIGVAIANFLPRIGLTTLYGGESTELENVFKGNGNIWGVGGSLFGPIFQGGRLYYSYKGSVAVHEESLLAYQQAVLTALGEVADALIARQKFKEAFGEIDRQVRALQESVRLATLRYTQGLANYYEVLEAQQQLFPAELSLARNRLNQLVAVVQLYRAVGGGWRAEEERYPEQYPLPRERLDRVVPVSATRSEP